MHYFKLSLVEALSENVKQTFTKTVASLEATLTKLANKINTKTEISDKKDTSLHSLRQAISKALILLQGDNTSDSTRRAVVNCFKLLETAKTTSLFAQDTLLNGQINKAYNSLKAMLSVQLDPNSYAEIRDILNNLNDRCIEKEVNSDVEQQRSTINSVGYVLQHVSELVSKDSLEITDDLISKFSTACAELQKSIRTTSDVNEILTKLEAFKDAWHDKFITQDTTKSGRQIANAGRDWKKDLINAGDSKLGTDLWQKFLQSEFGTAAEDVEGLGHNLKVLCKRYGYSEKSNPYLYYIKHFLLNSDNSVRLSLNSIAFYRVASAAEKSDRLRDELTGNPNTSQSLINCKQFYSLRSELMSIFLDLQIRLLSDKFTYVAERLEKPTDIFGKKMTFKAALGLDDSISEGSHYELTAKILNKILYQKPGTSSYGAILRPLKDIEDITETLKPGMLADIANSARTQMPEKLAQLAVDFGELTGGLLAQELKANSNKARFCATMLLLIHYASVHIEEGKLSDKDKESWQQVLTWKPNQDITKKYIARVLDQSLQDYLKLDEVKQAIAKFNAKALLDTQKVPSNTVKAWLNRLDNDLANDKTNKEIKQGE